MIEKLQGAAQIPQSRAGNPAKNASGVTSPAFGSMLQQQIGRRDAQRQAMGGQFPPDAVIQQSAIAQAVQQSLTAQAVQQSLNAQVVQQSLTAQGEPQSRINFSKHALARVEERGIEITPDLMGKLADSVEKAQEKGAKNILAFSDSQAFIVNIPYGRVITAMSGEEMRENIFTNIDGAVLL